MAKATYWQKGQSIDYTNPSADTVIFAGDVIELGSRIGVAGTEIPGGGTGSVVTEGVFILPHSTGGAEITLGTEVHWDKANGVVTATSGENTVPAGWCVESCSASAATVKVKLLG